MLGNPCTLIHISDGYTVSRVKAHILTYLENAKSIMRFTVIFAKELEKHTGTSLLSVTAKIK